MSDPRVTPLALERSRSQLPVSQYFDPAMYERELEQLFRRGPRYLGHALAVPEVGDFHTLLQEGEGRVLMRTPRGVEVLSNVCRHRQALMLRGRGNTRSNIVCPLHRWTYDLHGRLVGAPHFADDPCLDLGNSPVQTWNGLVFEAGPAARGRSVAAELAGLGAARELDFEGYVFDRAVVHECDYNWKTFIEVYLEDYHVAPFHPGLGEFVTCEDLRWEFGRHHSLQTVGAKNALAKAGSPAYRKWHEAVLNYRAGRFDNPVPQQGAIWLTYYPAVMVEWYPHVLVVSTLHPRGPRKTLNVVEFFYPEEIAAFEREFVEAQQAAYWETCAEDDEIALRMDAGRRALLERGDDDAGPYQSPMEDGMQQFHEWYQGPDGRTLTASTSAAAPARRVVSASWLMVLASFLFATMGVCVKLASARYSPGEIMFYRGLTGALLMTAIARSRRVSLATSIPATHFWRSLAGVTAMWMWFYALGNLPIATAMTLNYMSSVWMALFMIGGAAMIGTRRVDGRLIGTVLLGFAGVALVLRPTIGENQLWHGLIGLISGMISAMAYLQVTTLARAGEPEIRIVFYFSIGGSVFGLLTMLGGEVHGHSGSGLALLLSVGVLATAAQLLMTRAYSTGKTLVNASLQYLGIAFSFGYGLLLFGDKASAMAFGGMVLIVLAGLAATSLRTHAAPADTVDAPPET